jgi:hypothetical protein
MMTKGPEKDRDHRRADLEALMERAAQQPGIADVLALHEKYQARLTKLQAALGRSRAATFTTSDSTA